VIARLMSDFMRGQCLAALAALAKNDLVLAKHFAGVEENRTTPGLGRTAPMSTAYWASLSLRDLWFVTLAVFHLGWFFGWLERIQARGNYVQTGRIIDSINPSAI